MKKSFKSAIFIMAVAGFFIANACSAAVTQCSSLGTTKCMTSCSGDYSESASAGDAGCKEANTSWVCCKKPSSSSTSTTASLGETMTILNGSVDTGSLNGFMQLALNITKWILGLSGSATLLMFVYGGFMMLISGGSSDKVKQGKDIIVGAVVGLLIVFASYTIIGFILGDVMGVEKAKNGGWASSAWFK